MTGSRFVPKEHYDVKLEGAAPVGYRTISVGGIRDQLVFGQLDSFLDGSVASIGEKVTRAWGCPSRTICSTIGSTVEPAR